MTTLHKRLTALESSGARSRVRALVREIVNPGFSGSPRVRAEFYGQTLLRGDGEPEEAFRVRAIEAAKAAAPRGQITHLKLLGAEPRMQWAAGPDGKLVPVVAC
jgi:hypothetical protein